MAMPLTMARATAEGSEPSSTKPSGALTAGWAIIRGPAPRCGQVAVCTMNGWHKNTSPAFPVACAAVRHSARADQLVIGRGQRRRQVCRQERLARQIVHALHERRPATRVIPITSRSGVGGLSV